LKVLVMLPTYNERENIERMLRTLLDLEKSVEMRELGVEELSVVVVDDSSPDGTGKLVAGLAAQNPSRVHLIERHEKGRGTAGIAGFKYALMQDIDCVVEMDVDFSHNPRDIARLLREIQEYDIVIGSRFVGGGRTSDRSITRKLISRGAAFYTRLMLGINIRDWQSGFKCYRKQALASLNFNNFLSSGYSIGMETVYRLIKGGYNYIEIPITFTDRTQGKSKFSTKEIFSYLKVAWQLRRNKNSVHSSPHSPERI
jgi:dolichol-phosphate mannosyltransferase